MKLGDIVVVGDGNLAVVEEIFPYGDITLCHCHYIDSNGKPMVCPDSRCKGEHTCPIHGRNVNINQVRALPQTDIDFYKKSGILA